MSWQLNIPVLVEGKSFEVWDGDQLRDFTYVDDAVDAFLMTAVNNNTNGGIFNLGGENAISLKKLAELLISVNGGGKCTVKEFPSDRKRIDIGDYYSDHNLISSTIGWRPKVPLQEALKMTLDYYRKHINKYI